MKLPSQNLFTFFTISYHVTKMSLIIMELSFWLWFAAFSAVIHFFMSSVLQHSEFASAWGDHHKFQENHKNYYETIFLSLLEELALYRE